MEETEEGIVVVIIIIVTTVAVIIITTTTTTTTTVMIRIIITTIIIIVTINEEVEIEEVEIEEEEIEEEIIAIATTGVEKVSVVFLFFFDLVLFIVSDFFPFESFFCSYSLSYLHTSIFLFLSFFPIFPINQISRDFYLSLCISFPLSTSIFIFLFFSLSCTLSFNNRVFVSHVF